MAEKGKIVSPEIVGRAQRAEMWRHRLARIVAFVVPLIIGAVVIVLSQQVRTANNLRQAEQAEDEKRVVLLSLLSAHQDIETGSRGYVITGNPAFLQPYDTGRKELLDIWPRLAASYAENTREGAVLGELRAQSDLKLGIVQETIKLRQGGNKAEAEARIKSGRGKAIMDEIRRLIDLLLSHQRAEMAKTSARAEAAITNLLMVSFALLAALGVMLVMAWLVLHNSLRTREHALSEAEDLALRQKAIVNSVLDGIITLNPSGSIESANAAALRMFGYAEGELDRRDIGMLFARQPTIGKAAERLREIKLKSEKGAAHEVSGLRRDGSEFPTEVAVTVIDLSGGLRYVAVIRDITERKRVDQLKSDFVSTVSHELRTPLTSIAGALGLLKGGGAGALGERAERLISIAHNNANRLVRLINDILDIQKVEAGQMPLNNRKLDLKAAVATSIEEMRSYAAKFGVRFSLSAPMTPMLVQADNDRLAQVLTNLLSNACKFSSRDDTVEVTITPTDDFYRVTVADHGPGIPVEFRDRIFGKFAQADSSSSREKDGTGLGLSIVREIVQRLGGRVSFDSEPGHGARFHVDLPQWHEPAAGEGDPTVLICGNGAGTVLAGALRQAGYAVTLISDMASVRSTLALRKFDGIVVDMGFPGGAGIEIIEMVRGHERNADTPLLALGGRPGVSELDGAAALVLDWIRKPVDVRRLIDSVEVASLHLDRDKPRVLHVEDDRDVQCLVAEALSGCADVTTADSVAAARRMLANAKFDLVILDLALADGHGMELLPELRLGGDAPLPVVIFSAQDADPRTAELVDAYLTKACTPIEKLVSIVGSLAAPGGKRDDD